MTSAIQILSWVSTLIVARLLTPVDYGIVSMAAIYIGLAQVANQFGLSAAVIQQRDLTDNQISELGGLSVALSAFFMIMSLLLAAPISLFFGEPKVQPVIIVLSITFLTSGLQVLPRSLLSRELRFRELAWLDGIEAVAATITTLLLAIAGFGYWSLVAGLVLSRSIGSAVAMVWYPHRIRWPHSLNSIRRPLRLGAHITGASILWTAYQSADRTVAGRKLGTVALGEYTLAWDLASVPVEKIGSLIARTTPAVFASVQDDVAALRRYVLAMTEGVSILTFPAAIGFALVADEFVRVLLGSHWEAAVAPLRILALAGAFRSIRPVLSQALVFTGHSKSNLKGVIAEAIFMPCLFLVGSYWGVVGIGTAWLLGYPLVCLCFMVRYALRVCELSIVRYALSLWPALTASLIMSGSVIGIDQLLGAECSLPLRLTTKIAVGGLTYALTIVAFRGERLRSFIALVRQSGN